jgi:hypothetical protein
MEKREDKTQYEQERREKYTAPSHGTQQERYSVRTPDFT